MVILIMALFGLIGNCYFVSAQVSGNMILWGSGGYSTFSNDVSDISSSSGVGLGIGAGYEVIYKKFMVHLGAEYNHLKVSLEMEPFTVREDMYDSEGDYYIGNFSFIESVDENIVGNINFPLLAGFRFGQFYFFAGGKFGLNLSTNSSVETTVRSTGTYPNFIDDFENMPNHAFGQVKEISKSSYSIEQNFSMSCEIGMYLGDRQPKNQKKILYRLSAFCDYGLTNIHDNTVSEPILINSSEGGGFQPGLNSFMRSTTMKNSTVNMIYAGVKLTAVFGIKVRSKYDCYFNGNPNLRKRRR